MKPLVDSETVQAAKALSKKPEVVAEQKLRVRYHVEHPELEERPRKFLEAFAAILRYSHYGPALDQFARVANHCGRCALDCMLYRATGDPRDVPCYRSELLFKIYRRYFTLAGRLKARLQANPFELTDEYIEEMADAYWNCTACRKCVLECPMGIDHGMVTHLARYILSELGIAPRALVVSVREQLEGDTHNTSALPWPAIQDSMEFLEEEIEEDKGVPAKLPVDVEGAQYILFPPVSDFMMEAETLMGIALVFHATGDSFTFGSQYYDAINYGLFYSDRVLQRVARKIDAEAERLNASTILIGECGHASRTAKHYIPAFCGGERARPVMHIIEYTHRAWREGKLKLRADAVTDIVTYHDPCNIARQGWIVDQPRELLRAFCPNYVDMSPCGMENICCGGGGGTVSIDELRPYRTSIAGKMKAEQIRATGAKYCVAPCANCKKQLRELCEDQGVDCEIVGLHDLLYKAIILPDARPEATGEEDDGD